MKSKQIPYRKNVSISLLYLFVYKNQITDLYIDGGYNFINHNFVLESIGQRYFVEKVDSMIIGNSKLQLKKNLINLDKYADSSTDGNLYSNWRVDEKNDKNHIYFDLIESMNASWDKYGNIKRMEVLGELACNCQIDGIPELKLYLKFTKPFKDYYVHKCLLDNLETFEKEN